MVHAELGESESIRHVSRILVAPDSFTGTLTALQAACAIRDGWLSTAPAARIVIQPMSDGGPGFIDSLAARGGRRISVPASASDGSPCDADVLLVDGTAYVESAQTCAPLLPREPMAATSFGLGECIARAIDLGAGRIVVGLGGTGVSDGGAGLLAALGATSEGSVLTGGVGPLSDVSAVDLTAAHRRVAGVELLAASDVDVPLLGTRGAARGFAPQKGATPEQVDQIEAALSHFAGILGRRADGKDPAVALGAGAAGGIGFALMHLGGRRVPGIATVMDSSGIDGLIADADIVITGEGRFDWQSLQGKVVSGVAARSVSHARPVLVLAGQVQVGRREYVAAGVTEAHAVAAMVGEEQSLLEPAASLSALAARAARTWDR